VEVYLGLEIPRDFQLFLVYNSCDLAPRRSGVTYRGQRSESHPGKLNVKNGPPLSLSFFGFQKVVFLVINGFSIAIHTDSPSCLKIFCEYWLVGPFRQSFSFLKTSYASATTGTFSIFGATTFPSPAQLLCGFGKLDNCCGFCQTLVICNLYL